MLILHHKKNVEWWVKMLNIMEFIKNQNDVVKTIIVSIIQS